MNQQQVLSVTRDIMQALGTFLVTYGVFTSGTWEMVSGVTMMAVPIAWGLWTHTQASAVAVVAALPNTKVSADGSKIEMLDPVLADVAKVNATAPVPLVV